MQSLQITKNKLKELQVANILKKANLLATLQEKDRVVSQFLEV